jgi:hypothetical protein
MVRKGSLLVTAQGGEVKRNKKYHLQALFMCQFWEACYGNFV